MAKSKTDSSRKEQLIKFKQKQKIMSEQKNQTALKQPAVRQFPIWKSNDVFEITGAELEVLNNFIINSNQASAALNSIISRSIIVGKIQLDFEKLSEDNNTYISMTDEEKAPHKAEVEALIESLKSQVEAQVSVKES